MVNENQSKNKKNILKSIAERPVINRRRFLGSVGAATVLSQTTARASTPKEYTKKAYTLESFDGTKLIAKLYEQNEESDGYYVIPNGWSLSKKDVKRKARKLARQGKTVVQYDQRGYGESAGKKNENMIDRAGLKDYSAVVKYFINNNKIDENYKLVQFN